eukprot:scaffold90833_cov75-Phaeocystis_antarctica.AAC.2
MILLPRGPGDAGLGAPLRPTASVSPKWPVASAPLATGMRYHPYVKFVASPVPSKPWVAPSSWQKEKQTSAPLSAPASVVPPKDPNCCATRISNPSLSS